MDLACSLLFLDNYTLHSTFSIFSFQLSTHVSPTWIILTISSFLFFFPLISKKAGARNKLESFIAAHAQLQTARGQKSPSCRPTGSKWLHGDPGISLFQLNSNRNEQNKNKKIQQEQKKRVFSWGPIRDDGVEELIEAGVHFSSAHCCRCWCQDLTFQVLWCLDTTTLPVVCWLLTATYQLQSSEKPRQTYL